MAQVPLVSKLELGNEVEGWETNPSLARVSCYYFFFMKEVRLMVLQRVTSILSLTFVLLFCSLNVSGQEPKLASSKAESTEWIQTWIDANLVTLVEDYWWLHENPEIGRAHV